MVKVRKKYTTKIKQGDILKEIEFIESITEKSGNLKIKKIVFPLVVVLSQACDLNQDYEYRYGKYRDKNNQDKFLFSVLVAPLYNIDHLIEGNHLSLLERNAQVIPKYKKKDKFTTQYKNLIENEIPRYHYLEFEQNIPIVPSVVDFKHYFTINVETLKKIKKEKFVCSIYELYRENLTQRFAYFLGRIGLP